jgi:nucleoside-diphosphate-sugar epimerase
LLDPGQQAQCQLRLLKLNSVWMRSVRWCSVLIFEGQNRWSAVHRQDAASLFRLAVERGETGARYHGAAEEGLPFKQIAEAIGHGLGLPVRCLTREEAPAHFQWLAGFAALGMSASSAWTRAQLGWVPTGAGYFKS